MAAWKMIGFPGAHYDYQRVGRPRTTSACRSSRSASRAGPAGRRAERWPPRSPRSMRCWSASAGPARSWPAAVRCRAERAWRSSAAAGATRPPTSPPTFAQDELRYMWRHHLFQNVALRHADHPQQHRPAGAADAPPRLVPARHRRRRRAACTGTARSGASCRPTSRPRATTRSATASRRSPHDLTIQDYAVTYDELEPHYDMFDKLCGTSGKAGNCSGQIQPAAIRSKARARPNIPTRRCP